MYDMLNKPTRFQIFSLKKISKVLQVVITSPDEFTAAF